MQFEINDAKGFSKIHLLRMDNLKNLIKKFVVDKDEYMIENNTFVCE